MPRKPDPSDDFTAGVRTDVIEQLRDYDTPLDRSTRQYVAEELEMLWFMTPQERRLVRNERSRRAWAQYLEGGNKFLRKRDNISRAKAMETIAESLGSSVEAIKQALKPSRIVGKKRPRKK
jgi:hypothetical protein